MKTKPKTPHRPSKAKSKTKPVTTSKRFLRFAAYVPCLVIFALTIVISGYHPGGGQVLSYATTMSITELLNDTNQQRAANGSANLGLNAQLNSAAQAKANDMVARDYWAHDTPDGQPPWVFFQNAGYSYSKAGENLAYGFATAADTITGWMNSPGHKANLLDTAFQEVGFGFANSPNFVGTGQETIIVAEYGKPLNPSPTPPPAATASTAPTPPPAATQTTPTPPSPTPAPEPVATKPSSEPLSTIPTDNEKAKPTATTTSPPVSDSKQISRIQLLSQGVAPWSTAVASLAAVSIMAMLVFSHARGVKRFFLQGERFVLHHFSIDLTIFALGLLAVVLTHGAGVVR